MRDEIEKILLELNVYPVKAEVATDEILALIASKMPKKLGGERYQYSVGYNEALDDVSQAIGLEDYK